MSNKKGAIEIIKTAPSVIFSFGFKSISLTVYSCCYTSRGNSATGHICKRRANRASVRTEGPGQVNTYYLRLYGTKEINNGQYCSALQPEFSDE